MKPMESDHKPYYINLEICKLTDMCPIMLLRTVSPIRNGLIPLSSYSKTKSVLEYEVNY